MVVEYTWKEKMARSRIRKHDAWEIHKELKRVFSDPRQARMFAQKYILEHQGYIPSGARRYLYSTNFMDFAKAICVSVNSRGGYFPRKP